MSRDVWTKKKANASGDNGWAERVSTLSQCELVYKFTVFFDCMKTE